MIHTLKLHLSSELYQRLKEQAKQQNKGIEEVALQVLQNKLNLATEAG